MGQRPIIIAGPCVAESEELLFEVAGPLEELGARLGFDLVLKASFDKANRSSMKSYRGPGLQKTLAWFRNIKEKMRLPVLTDIHETSQVQEAAEVCDWLQIPAFLCRQTDLLCAAAATGRTVNVKKGQFLAPGATQLIVNKLREGAELVGKAAQIALTERGSSFGYGDYIVDMRSLPEMAKTGAMIIYDVTHSVQRPTAVARADAQAGGERAKAPVLARAAAATGYLSGFFMEVHPTPAAAKSDKETVLSVEQATALLEQLIPLWTSGKAAAAIDSKF